jgi:hypothetical protein
LVLETRVNRKTDCPEREEELSGTKVFLTSGYKKTGAGIFSPEGKIPAPV